MKNLFLLSALATIVHSTTTMDACDITFTELTDDDTWMYSWSFTLYGADRTGYDVSYDGETAAI